MAASVADALARPADLVMTILELRALQRTHEALAHAEKGSDVPEGAMKDLLGRFAMELNSERRERRKK